MLAPAPKIHPGRWSEKLKSLPVLSIRQPFAWLVVNGIKDIENRSWQTHKRGPVLIHASMNTDFLSEEVRDECQTIAGVQIPDSYDIGCVIGVAEIFDCVRNHPSAWKVRGQWGWVLTNARPLPPRECKGAVGFFYPKW